MPYQQGGASFAVETSSFDPNYTFILKNIFKYIQIINLKFNSLKELKLKLINFKLCLRSAYQVIFF